MRLAPLFRRALPVVAPVLVLTSAAVTVLAVPPPNSASSTKFAITGPSSSQSPYLRAVTKGAITVSLMSVGDAVNFKPDGVTPYRFVGIPDGLGAFDNGDGTFSVVMNHEIPVNVVSNVANPVGIARAHGNAGAFVSLWTIAKVSL